MMGSLITRGLIMAVGYVYPAYKCFKCVEMNRPDVEQLRFWCQYWIIIAVVTVLERLGDTFVSWLPLYSEAKLAFIIYLWCPKTLGTNYVYSSFLRPLVALHEGDIDRHLNEFTTRAGDMLAFYWQKGSAYAQSRFMELLQFVASQAPPARPEQGPGMFQGRPQVQGPPLPPCYQEFAPNYYQAPPATDYSPSAPVLPPDYFPQQGIPTGGAGSENPMQPLQQVYPQQIPGYPHQIPGYPQPPYVRAEQEAPSQSMATHHPAAPEQEAPSRLMATRHPVAPTRESVSSNTTRRQRTHRQS